MIHRGWEAVHAEGGIELSEGTGAHRHAASFSASSEEDEAGTDEGEALGANEGGKDDGKEDVDSSGGGGQGGRGGRGAPKAEEGDGVGCVRADGGQGVGGRLTRGTSGDGADGEKVRHGHIWDDGGLDIDQAGRGILLGVAFLHGVVGAAAWGVGAGGREVDEVEGGAARPSSRRSQAHDRARARR